MAKDILDESFLLLRNSLAHSKSADASTLTRWFSDVVQAVMHSPAVSTLCNGSTIVVTGAFGRGHGLPTSGMQWLLVTADDADVADVSDAQLTKFCQQAQLVVQPTLPWFTPAPRAVWEQRIAESVAQAHGIAMGLFADASTWMAPHLLHELSTHADQCQALLDHALSVRPPALEVIDGLPKRDRVVDIHAELVVPLAKLARWAGAASASTATATDQRITAAEEAGVLHRSEAEFLRDAWNAAIALQLRRWADRAGGHVARWDHLPQLDRSSFGAASRMLSDVFTSVVDRNADQLSSSGKGN